MKITGCEWAVNVCIDTGLIRLDQLMFQWCCSFSVFLFVFRLLDGQRRTSPWADVVLFTRRALSYTGVVFTWASLVPAAHHGSHAESHALVLVHHVGEQLGGRRNRDALLVAKLVDAALAGQQALPEAAVGSSTGHGAQKVGVDLNHLLNRLRGDVGARCGPRVHRNNDAMLEL